MPGKGRRCAPREPLPEQRKRGHRNGPHTAPRRPPTGTLAGNGAGKSEAPARACPELAWMRPAGVPATPFVSETRTRSP
eukprot:4870407-Pyramimonas_sp.AAC.1